ncbi:HEPN domain-containing protein [Leptolyngbya boryana CZ1]|uniref:HEPN domain-containing protein n=1 Tax=Leptolyngbya boryana CZ1 TaxID=3060204 RepID=A0AA97API8_LEPBY|nr:HEPN domain-containing protein [Leptolyngbya boryana]WNZ46778.1 HEPN domain-containing protein [Leptolyngbya boryana CZ1]
MQSALDQFRISIGRVRDLIALHNSVKAQATGALDVSDMLRAALVLAVSALDYYVHEVVVLGMVEIHRGQRSEPAPSANTTYSAFSRFQVSLGGARQDRLTAIDIASWLETEIQQTHGYAFLQQPYMVSALIPAISDSIMNRLNNASWLEDEIRERLGYQSFQQADKIADAIRYVSDKRLWDEVATKMSKSAKDIKQQLNSIVDRRNKIAHEADIDPTFNIGSRWSIDEVLVGDAVDFINQLVESIHQIL